MKKTVNRITFPLFFFMFCFEVSIFGIDDPVNTELNAMLVEDDKPNPTKSLTSDQQKGFWLGASIKDAESKVKNCHDQQKTAEKKVSRNGFGTIGDVICLFYDACTVGVFLGYGNTGIGPLPPPPKIFTVTVIGIPNACQSLAQTNILGL